MNWSLFSAFVLVAAVLYITPGPVVTLVVTAAARNGVRAGLMTVAGGVIGHAALLACIAFGLSWVLQRSAEIFDYVRWIGAAYLVWLGIQAWRRAGIANKIVTPSGRVHVWRGLVVAITNPKTIAFFTAFLPQFIDPSLPIQRQLLVMCVTSLMLGGFLDSGWAIAAGLGRTFFIKSGHHRLLGRFSGLVLIGGGVWLSLARAR